VTINVVAKPPLELLQDDTFEFTIRAVPSGNPIAAQPLDLSASASPNDGLFGFGSLSNTAIIFTVLVLGLFGVLLVFLPGRSRKTSRGESSMAALSEPPITEDESDL
jgi:hypothetical protein